MAEDRTQIDYHLNELVESYTKVWDENDAETFEAILKDEIENEATRNKVRLHVLMKRDIAVRSN